MMKRLSIILLTIVFLLSPLSLLPVKRVSASEGPDILLCAAEPWSWGYHSSKGGSGGSSESSGSGGDNQGISTNHSVIKHSTNSSTQTPSYQREHRNIIKQRNQSLGWRLKFLLFWQMIFNR